MVATLSCPLLSAGAGLAGALASVSAKFVMGNVPSFVSEISESVPVSPALVSALFRLFFIATTIVLNGVMWTLYMKALKISKNSLQALGINTACNFITSAAFGYLLFGDDITRSWVFGAALMLTGVVLMNTGEGVLTQPTHSEERQKEL